MEKARIYLGGLHEAFQLLAEEPGLGRDLREIRDGLRRHVHRSHVVYYRASRGGVLIIDVLGRGQDPGLHLGGER